MPCANTQFFVSSACASDTSNHPQPNSPANAADTSSFAGATKTRASLSLEHIAEALKARKIGRSSYMAKCPSHEDRTPSLKLSEKNGRILVHCFAGCRQADVLQRLTELGLWSTEKLTDQERETRARTRMLAERRNQRMRELSARLDVLKMRALEREDWPIYERICKMQYRACSCLESGKRRS